MSTKITSDEEYARIARNQKTFARNLAKRVERGEALEGPDAEFVAGLIRHWAENLSEEKPKQRGQQPKFPSDEARLLFGIYVTGGMSRREARAKLAEHYDVSEEAIKKVVKKT